jgi:hypothetical protein
VYPTSATQYNQNIVVDERTALAGERVSVSSAEPFAVTTNVPHAIRLALGSVDLPTLKGALGAVKRVIGLQSAWAGAVGNTQPVR